MFKDFTIDLFLASLKAQSQKKVFQEISYMAAPVCGAAQDDLEKLFDLCSVGRSFAPDQGGVAVFDVQSSFVKSPLIVLATLENSIEFKMFDAHPVDIFACVLSPRADVGVHLQKVSWISRLLKDDLLCDGLRSAKNCDAMRVLFMPQSRAGTAAA